MKKFLSLVLALIMTMSLVTVSAGAADFTDADDMNYADAVEVMNAVGVVGGYADGSFAPEAGLTRGAAAKIVCNMILGPTTAAALAADTAPATDVPVDHVFAGYIAYCMKEGIVSGYADGSFKPAAPLTGYAFMKMLLGALGYDADIEGYVGANWSINVAKRALNIGLDSGLKGDFNGAKALTREEACLYAFNALKSDMVSYGNKSSITVGDITITTSAEAAPVTNVKNDDKIWDETGTDVLQFAEKYFDDLSVTRTTDAYGRPATAWYWDNDKIGTYADEADFIYVNEFDKDAKKALEKADYVLTSAEIIYNGSTILWTVADLMTPDQKAVNGFTIEMYNTNDDDKVIETIVVIEEYFAQVGKFTAASEKKGTEAKVELKVIEWGFPTGKTLTVWDDPDSDTDAYDKLSAFEKDDYVTIVAKQNWNVDASKGADNILAVNAVEAVEGKVQKIVKGTYTCTTTVKVDGETYGLNNECVGLKANVNAGDQVTLYLDAQGCVIGYESDSTATNVANLVYVTKVFNAKDKYGATTYYAQIVRTNGDVEEIELKADQSTLENTICSYSYAAAGDTAYTLASASAVEAVSGEIKASDVKIMGDYVTDDVVFVFVKKEGAKLAVTTAEGVQKVASVPANSFSVKNTDGDVAVVFIRQAASAAIDADNLVYINSNAVAGSALDADGKMQNTYNFYIDGEKYTEIAELNGLGYMTYAVDGETYKFTAVAEADGAYNNKVATIAKDKYVTVASVCTDATVTGEIYDLTTNNVETLAELADLTGPYVISFVYDKDDNVITSLYIISIG